ncbi:MAG: hypothetical protein JW862_00525 [Anaerolineales bacterium]|nr:hypothetical protein [Anaerolineales bacterium]
MPSPKQSYAPFSAFVRLLMLLSGLLLLVACATSTSSPQVEVTATLTETPPPTTTTTPEPTVTPLPPVGLLLAPEGADARLVDRMQNLLSQRISAAGLRYQVRPALSVQDFERDRYQWVIALPPLDNLPELVAAAPETDFLAYGFSGLEPATNLTVLSLPQDAELQQAFMAGYIAAVITPDWRIGMIGLTEPATTAAREAFKAGALFYCSSPSGPDQELFCRPKYAPIYQYPFYVAADPNATSGEWEATARTLLNYVVETVYVYPGAGGDDLLRYLDQEGVRIIGGQNPPAAAESQWVTSLTFDLLQSFSDYWPQFAAGEVGMQIEVPLVLSSVNPEQLSPGRQAFVELMLAEVQAGRVSYQVSQPEP